MPKAFTVVSRSADRKLRGEAKRLLSIWDERKVRRKRGCGSTRCTPYHADPLGLSLAYAAQVFGSAQVKVLKEHLASAAGPGAAVQGPGSEAAPSGPASSDLERRKLAAVGSLADVLFEVANAAARSSEEQTKCLQAQAVRRARGSGVAACHGVGTPCGPLAQERDVWLWWAHVQAAGSATATLADAEAAQAATAVALECLRAEVERRKKAVTYVKMHLSGQVRHGGPRAASARRLDGAGAASSCAVFCPTGGQPEARRGVHRGAERPVRRAGRACGGAARRGGGRGLRGV
jgi:regulator of Ty1 transposition protein 103